MTMVGDGNGFSDTKKNYQQRVKYMPLTDISIKRSIRAFPIHKK
jgi:hypothetical protein